MLWRLLMMFALALPGPVFAAESQTAEKSSDVFNEEDLAAYSKWMTAALAAGEPTQVAFARIQPQVNAIAANMKTPAQAKAAAVRLNALIAEVRPVQLASRAQLMALAPLPDIVDARMPVSTRQLKTDLLRLSERTIAVLDDTAAMAEAIGNNDRAKTDVLIGRIKQGTTVLIEGQLITIRARRGLLPKNDPTNQAMGALEVLYQSMALIVDSTFNEAPWPSQKLLALSDQTLTLALVGRDNLIREKETLSGFRPSNERDRQLVAMAMRINELESETFGIADEMASHLRTVAAGPPTGSRVGVVTKMSEFEARLQGVSAKQVEVSAGSR